MVAPNGRGSQASGEPRTRSAKTFDILDLNDTQRYENWNIQFKNEVAKEPERLRDLEVGPVTYEHFCEMNTEFDESSEFDRQELGRLYAEEITRYKKNDAETFRILVQRVDLNTDWRLRKLVANVTVDDRSGFDLYGEITRKMNLLTP